MRLQTYLTVKMLNKELIKELEGINYLVASKYYDEKEIAEFYQLGVKDFGENRCQDFLEKYQLLKSYDITWHFIGHLQTNKVKYVINKFDYLHSLDSYHLAKYIDKYRLTPLDCYLQVKLVQNDNKYGIHEDEILPLLDQIKELKNVHIIGLMTILDDQMDDSLKFELYHKLAQKRDWLKDNGYPDIKYLSAGMSNDYLIALKAGSTILRLGRIFKK